MGLHSIQPCNPQIVHPKLLGLKLRSVSQRGWTALKGGAVKQPEGKSPIFFRDDGIATTSHCSESAKEEDHAVT